MTLVRGREQRRFKRLQLSVPAIYLAEDGGEQAATLLDISAGGLALMATERPALGTHIVVYVDEFGRVEGRVVRHLDSGFAIEFTVTDGKRERLAQRLDSLGHDDAIKIPASPPQNAKKPHFVLGDGSQIECRVLDMSVQGVSLQVGKRPAIGAQVTIGRMRGRIKCHHATGVEIEFLS